MPISPALDNTAQSSASVINDVLRAMVVLFFGSLCLHLAQRQVLLEKLACPAMRLLDWDGSEKVLNQLSRSFIFISRRDEYGRRPVYGGAERFQTDAYWRDYILFYEYFHGDNGAGILAGTAQLMYVKEPARQFKTEAVLKPAEDMESVSGSRPR